jgi:hypothetical protein
MIYRLHHSGRYMESDGLDYDDINMAVTEAHRLLAINEPGFWVQIKIIDPKVERVDVLRDDA